MKCIFHSLFLGFIGVSLFTYFLYFSSFNFPLENNRKIIDTYKISSDKIMSPLLIYNSSPSQPDLVYSTLLSPSANTASQSAKVYNASHESILRISSEDVPLTVLATKESTSSKLEILNATHNQIINNSAETNGKLVLTTKESTSSKLEIQNATHNQIINNSTETNGKLVLTTKESMSSKLEIQNATHSQIINNSAETKGKLVLTAKESTSSKLEIQNATHNQIINNSAETNGKLVLTTKESTSSKLEIQNATHNQIINNSAETNGKLVLTTKESTSSKLEIQNATHNQIINNSAETNGKLTYEIYESGYSYSNTELCPDFGTGLKLLIMITSAPSHKDARTAIRQTWGHFGQRSDVSIAFFLGSSNKREINRSLENETSIYNDLIIARFIDSYNNLTLKTVSILQWVDTFCPHVKLILKTDDDMFINVPALLNFTEKHIKDQQTIFGRLAKKWKPVRYEKSKYFLSPQEFSPTVFPDFTTGPAYLLTSDVISKLYKTALQRTYLKLEDVFITGIIAGELGIKKINVQEFFNQRVGFTPCNIQNGISIHMVEYNEQFDLWKKLFDKNFICTK